MVDLSEQLTLVEQMPMTFHALVIEYTTRCNARCGMCYQAAGPRGSDLLGRATLEDAVVEQVIREAAEIEAIGPRLHVTGGEGFLRADLLLRMIAVGRDVGYAELTTTTNAYWARDPAAARETCTRAREAGMTGMEISWDFWHEPFIRADAVSNCLEACLESGIEANLRLLSSRSHSYHDALARLRPDALACAARITCAPVLPTGRATIEVGVAEAYRQGSLDDTCHGMLNLTVNAVGNVSPCCAGLDQVREPYFGNVRERPLRQLVQALDRSLLARILVFRGPGALAKMLAAAGAPVPGDHAGICHLCWSIFASPERVRIIEDALARRRTDALVQAIAALRAPSTESHAPT